MADMAVSAGRTPVRLVGTGGGIGDEKQKNRINGYRFNPDDVDSSNISQIEGV